MNGLSPRNATDRPRRSCRKRLRTSFDTPPPPPSKIVADTKGGGGEGGGIVTTPPPLSSKAARRRAPAPPPNTPAKKRNAPSSIKETKFAKRIAAVAPPRAKRTERTPDRRRNKETNQRKGTRSRRHSPSVAAAATKTKKKSSNGRGKQQQQPYLLASDLEAIRPENPWIDLRVPPEELRPSATLTTGQCFHWIVVRDDVRRDDDDNDDESPSDRKPSAWGTHDETEWVAPLGNDWVVSIREMPTTTLCRVLHGPTDGVLDLLREYFQLETPLAPLYGTWSRSDARLKRIAEAIPGVRIIRQDPVECLFSFICSSNNNIPRITKMLAALREKYGDFLIELPARFASVDGSVEVGSMKLYSFPSLGALKSATDKELREMGLGYRAKYIVETRDLLTKAGGDRFLFGLRGLDADPVQEELIKFSGIGRKVADCVALFSLDQAGAIPVDVHVRNIACRDYDPTLLESTKSITPTVYRQVGDLFRSRFPSHAGWAHSLLFVAELPSFRDVLPEDVVAEQDAWKKKEAAKKAAERKGKR